MQYDIFGSKCGATIRKRGTTDGEYCVEKMRTECDGRVKNEIEESK